VCCGDSDLAYYLACHHLNGDGLGECTAYIDADPYSPSFQKR